MARRALDDIARVYTAAECRALDAYAIHERGIPGIVLMKRAGRAVFEVVIEYWPSVAVLTVVCGAGNNAGDGYVVAGLARNRGIDVQLLQLGVADRLTGDAAVARDWACQQGVVIDTVDAEAPNFSVRGDVVVDALLGTGIVGEVRAGYRAAFAAVQRSAKPVVAVDVPSGLCSDTGAVRGAALPAAVTVTFIGVKRGLLTAAGPDYAGALVFDDLDAPAAPTVSGIATSRWPALARELPRRRATAHKNDSGHVAILGGDRGMGGAVAMAGEAALKAGAGLVSVATRGAHASALLARRPELMVRGVEDDLAGLSEVLARASVVAVGPGLGRQPWGAALLDAAIDSGLPLILDADALNLCAARGRRPTAAIVTPHPGEAARLLDTDTATVQADRFHAARAIARQFAGTTVLKGAGSLIDDGSEVSICLHGNPGMASGGMGDVLTGVVAGLHALGLSGPTAARLGVALHSAAGDRAAAARGRHGLLATDLIAAIGLLLNDGA